MSAINETLIRDVVADVLGRLGGAAAATPTAPAASAPAAPAVNPACGCPMPGTAPATGECVTNPETFGRVRRCVMVDNLKTY